MITTKKAATNKAAATKKAPVAKMVATDLDKLISIEKEPPPFSLMGQAQIREAAIEKIKKLAADCPVGAALLLPAKYRIHAMRMLNHDYGQFKWTARKIEGNAEQIRIYKQEFPHAKKAPAPAADKAKISAGIKKTD